MKPTNFTTGRILLVVLITGLTIGLVSWDRQKKPGHFQQALNDTVPPKKSPDREKKIRDLDDALDELNEADLKMNMEKIQQEIADAMKNIDGDKIRLEVEKALREADMDKIRKEVETSLATVDFDKIKAEIADAMKEVDMTKIRKEMQESFAKADPKAIGWDNMKAELERVKNIDKKKLDADLQRVKEEMKDIGPNIEKEMEKAKTEIEKAKVEIKEYKEFVNSLENDGLINKKEGYSLSHKDGELFINGKKASEQTYKKYRPFLERHKKFSMKKDNDDFDIDLD